MTTGTGGGGSGGGFVDWVIDTAIVVVANVAFNYLFGQTSDVEGPRLNDLSVTTSRYGAPIPLVYGNNRLAGQVIWGAPLREIKSEEGGKGGGPSVTTYQYHGSWAVGLCEGNANLRLGRIWLDRKIVYDPSGPVPYGGQLSFTFYPGTETQMPDPMIESYEGQGNVPPHRGLCYIVFNDMPLAVHGNRIPNVEVELIKAGQLENSYDVFQQFAGSIDISNAMFDLKAGVLVRSVFTGGDNGIRLFSAPWRAEFMKVQLTNFEEGVYGDGLMIGYNGSLGNSRPLVFRGVLPGGGSGGFGSQSTSTSMSDTSFTALRSGPSTMTRDGRYSITSHQFGGCGVVAVPNGQHVWHMQQTGRYFVECISSFPNLPFYESDFFTLSAMTTSTTSTNIAPGVTLEFAHYLIDDKTDEGEQKEPEVVERLSVSIPLDDLLGPSGVREVNFGVYDYSDNTVIIGMTVFGSPNVQYLFKVSPTNGDVLWITTATPGWPVNHSPAMHSSHLFGNTLGLWNGSVNNPVVYQVDTRTGDYGNAVALEPRPLAGPTAVNMMCYDSISETLYWSSGAVHYAYRWGMPDLLSTPVSDIVSDICRRAGLGPLDIDVTDLAGLSVMGYMVSTQGPARDAIEPLAAGFFFDAVESDYVLKFRKRGSASVRSISYQDLVDRGQEDYITPTRLQEFELPRRFAVTYKDLERDYEPGTQKAQRILAPDPAVATTFEATFNFPVVLTGPSIAKQTAEKALFNSWAERTRLGFTMSWKHADLDPTDVIDLTLDDGSVFVSRIASFVLGADLRIETASVVDQASSYISTADADGGAGPPVIPQTNGLTNMFILNSPLLRDNDDLARIASRGYIYAAGYNLSDAWAGCTVSRSTDGVGYLTLDKITQEVAWGTTASALGTPPLNEMFQTDEENVLRVFMVVGADRLESVTQLDMLNGANKCAILKADGEIEIIHFRDVTYEGDGIYALSGLLRGQRGTDTMAFNHLSGEEFILTNNSLELKLNLPIFVGQINWFRARGTGSPLELAENEMLPWACRDLQPYAPWNVEATEYGGDITLEWQRRTRINGRLVDGTGTVPLNEDNEVYEIEIYDGPGGNLVRTLNSVTNQVTYEDADVIDDFGSTPLVLTVRVYQISAQVGRGFSHEFTIDVQ